MTKQAGLGEGVDNPAESARDETQEGQSRYD